MSSAADLAARLAAHAEAVCRYYLPAGRREGRYWLVGSVEGSPGRSLYVRLQGAASGAGAAGKWTDAATGEHGDLLDLIARNRGLSTLRETLDEARRFLDLPRPVRQTELSEPAPSGSPQAARRLLAISRPIAGTLAETYLRGRALAPTEDWATLRFHPRCWYRPTQNDAPDCQTHWPALLATVTDREGYIAGLHRTWLDRAGGKAPVATPRRAMGHLLGNAVRFGRPRHVVAAGEGLETMLSLRSILPTLPALACLSANHLAAVELPAGVQRLYVARERDPAGHWATEALSQRARAAGIEPLPLDCIHGDLNDDLRLLGAAHLRGALREQLVPEDVVRFMPA